MPIYNASDEESVMELYGLFDVVSDPVLWFGVASALVSFVIFVLFVVRLNKYHHDNRFKTIEDFQNFLRQQEVRKLNVIFAFDFSGPLNDSKGRRSFRGNPLHTISTAVLNPYQRVIALLGDTLNPFLASDDVYALGYGGGRGAGSVFSLSRKPWPSPCEGMEGVMERYCLKAETTTFPGPACLDPVLEEATRIAKHVGGFNVLIIVCPGLVSSSGGSQVEFWKETQTRAAMVEAAAAGVSVVCVGVGDGPFVLLETLDSLLPRRQCNAFQFASFEKCMRFKHPEVRFVRTALWKLSTQYKTAPRPVRKTQRRPSLSTSKRVEPITPVSPLPAALTTPKGKYNPDDDDDDVCEPQHKTIDDSPPLSPTSGPKRRVSGGNFTPLGSIIDEGEELAHKEFEPLDLTQATVVAGAATNRSTLSSRSTQSTARTVGSAQSSSCRICMDRTANSVFLPCRHLTSCKRCSRTLKHCPVCRQPVDKVLEVFYG